MDTNLMKLRTAAFGGFNKQDVISYIEKIKNEAYEEQTRLQRQIKDLKEKNSELEDKVSSFGEEKDALIRRIDELSADGESKNETVEEINEATNHLKNVADELCRSLRDFMQRISENCCSVIIEGDDGEAEEEFDGAKFMAELEAEIYAKLGVEETENQETEPEAEEAPAEEASQNEAHSKVSDILSSLGAFSSTEDRKEEDSDDEEDTTVSDILGALSFLK